MVVMLLFGCEKKLFEINDFVQKWRLVYEYNFINCSSIFCIYDFKKFNLIYGISEIQN